MLRGRHERRTLFTGQAPRQKADKAFGRVPMLGATGQCLLRRTRPYLWAECPRQHTVPVDEGAFARAVVAAGLPMIITWEPHTAAQSDPRDMTTSHTESFIDVLKSSCAGEAEACTGRNGFEPNSERPTLDSFAGFVYSQYT